MKTLIGIAVLLAANSFAAPFIPVTAGRITRGAGAPSSALCAAQVDVGKVYIRSDAAASNASFNVCVKSGASAFGWELLGTPSGTLITFTQTGTGAVARSFDSAAKEVFSVKDYGVVGDGTTNDAANLQKALDAAAAAGACAYFPAGTYKTNTMLTVTGCVELSPLAIVQAGAAMTAVVKLGPSVALTRARFRGGIIDANDNATDGVWLNSYAHVAIENTIVTNAVAKYFRATSGYEAIFLNVYGIRTTGTLTAGSVGLYIDTTATDSHIEEAHFVGQETGVSAQSGGNFFTDIHVWSTTALGAMVTGFDDNGTGNFWRGDEADTVSTYGLRVRLTRAQVVSCRFYNNTTSGADNVAIGIHFDTAAALSSVIASNFLGADASHRFLKDVEGATSAFAYYGNRTQNVSTIGSTDTLNGVSLAALATGLAKITTGTGAVSIGAVADVTGLFTSCSGSITRLNSDGTCHAPTGIFAGNGSNTGITLSSTGFMGLGRGAFQAAVTAAEWFSPNAVTLQNFYFQTNGSQPASGNMVCTVADNGTPGTITITVALSGGSATFSDTSHTMSIVAGHKVSLACVNNATATSAIIGAWSIGVY